MDPRPGLHRPAGTSKRSPPRTDGSWRRAPSGPSERPRRPGRDRVDLAGRVAVPGLTDAHLHLAATARDGQVST